MSSSGDIANNLSPQRAGRQSAWASLLELLSSRYDVRGVALDLHGSQQIRIGNVTIHDTVAVRSALREVLRGHADAVLAASIFHYGEFTVRDVDMARSALMAYAVGMFGFTLVKILAPAFFARSDTKGPMRFALASVAVNIALGLLLFRLVGFQGIAAATAIARPEEVERNAANAPAVVSTDSRSPSVPNPESFASCLRYSRCARRSSSSACCLMLSFGSCRRGSTSMTLTVRSVPALNFLRRSVPRSAARSGRSPRIWATISGCRPTAAG